ncbi:MAG: isoleucine--tRNA ligase, partial [Patescibacteria group bacterium]
MFKPVTQQINFPSLEEEITRFWKENKTFEKSVEKRPESRTWTFLDGPPFVTGMPHYGSLLPRIAKDVFPRYWTMKGFRVRRVWGWDGHGLPIENKVETKLKIKRKKDIEEKIGVQKFIEECLKYVEETSSEWEWYVDRIGEWVDFKNAYKTWDTPYMESVLWVFRQIYDKGKIYKGMRVSLYCPHCSTPISNFEVAMDSDNYQEITEPANTYMYKLKDEDSYLLAWSTTPWNKIATNALAVNPNLDYIQIFQQDQHLILAKNTVKILNDKPYKIEKEFKGSDLVGKSFEPHYDFYSQSKKPDEKNFIVVAGEFVTEDEGTGIVTIAAYGEDDMAVMKQNHIQIVLHVDDEGNLRSDVPNWAGMNYLEVNPLVNEDLKKRGLLYSESPHTHTIPTCWRCHTRLFYAPQDAWYIDVQSLKGQMAKINEEVNWFPHHFKHGRFLNSLMAAPDWCISRSRYWGSPVPVWECEKCGDRFVPESIKELEGWSGQKVINLHKPYIDEITGKCSKCDSVSRRVPEVLDSWIEAGSASFAERHYPFDASQKLNDFFPPDFIVEYTGQIRAWFYVLHVISTSIFQQKAFKNAVVTGVIAGTDGRKMSKNFGNYPDPREMLEKYGGDALRLYLLSQPIMRGEDMRISEEEYRNQVRTCMLTIWNVYNFFVTYANLDNYDHTKIFETTLSVLDNWILTRLVETTGVITKSLESYDTVEAIESIKLFISDMSTWYIRRSRDRVGPSAKDSADKHAFYSTCHHVLVTLCQLMAPLTPFITEEIYKNLTGQESVHLTDWPKATTLTQQDSQLI